MPSSACNRAPLDTHAFPTRRSSDLVSDIRMPGASGLELLQSVKQKHPELPVIIMTAYSDLESAVAAFQGGAFEYLPKPFDVDHAVEDRKSTRLNSSHLGISYAVFCVQPRSPRHTRLPYTTLFRSRLGHQDAGCFGARVAAKREAEAPGAARDHHDRVLRPGVRSGGVPRRCIRVLAQAVRRRSRRRRSEEHTSELQSLRHLVCRLLRATALP